MCTCTICASFSPRPCKACRLKQSKRWRIECSNIRQPAAQIEQQDSLLSARDKELHAKDNALHARQEEFRFKDAKLRQITFELARLKR